MVSLFLKRAIMMAKPTAASAAATVIIKNTNIWPVILPKKAENVIKTRFIELSINSMLINTIIAFLLRRTPITPIENNIRARIRK
jgi:hypothetical protein